MLNLLQGWNSLEVVNTSSTHELSIGWYQSSRLSSCLSLNSFPVPFRPVGYEGVGAGCSVYGKTPFSGGVRTFTESTR